jgi:hypothetical protein
MDIFRVKSGQMINQKNEGCIQENGGLHFLLAEMHEHQTLKTRQQEDLLQ